MRQRATNKNWTAIQERLIEGFGSSRESEYKPYVELGSMISASKENGEDMELFTQPTFADRFGSAMLGAAQ